MLGAAALSRRPPEITPGVGVPGRCLPPEEDGEGAQATLGERLARLGGSAVRQPERLAEDRGPGLGVCVKEEAVDAKGTMDPGGGMGP